MAADRQRLKAHGFCPARGSSTLAVVLANPHPAALVAEVALAAAQVREAASWTLRAEGGLAATRATINGEPAGEDGTIPEPSPRVSPVTNGIAEVPLEPESLTFVTVTCRQPVPACDH